MRTATRAIRYLLGGGPTAIAALLALVAVATSGILSIVGIGIPLLSWTLHGVRSLAGVEQRRAARLLDPDRRPAAHRRDPASPDRPPLGAVLRDPATCRELLWLALHGTTGLPAAGCCLALGLFAVAGLATPLVWWIPPAEAPMTFVVPITDWPRALTLPPLVAIVSLTALRWAVPFAGTTLARIYRVLLAPSSRSRLTARVVELTATRAGAMDAHAAELRRIERDLHDGAQARLVAIAIQLAVAQRQRDAAPQVADQLVEKARAGVEDALAELREVVRSVYPPILADRGLPGAIHALAAACPVPLTARIAPLDRLPAAVETAAYFVIAEALTNIAKHSAASRAGLWLTHENDRLVLRITDNGVGGADESRGTGLAGIRRRAAALDGYADVSSPPSGPTELRVELPCAS
ncbi:sensor domain-containing protein [Plantactinospora sp. S1510]|uniref:histidine kinase n=1 Tax=Plantactinospora alkalitolerans TaxID=2789879 RepID=A0ABS0H4J2_9ACTN|nr:sensor histidine kinase [Plantactinospora alkalitolerans]MBF9133133.1 sensor domain-containing protein [Plantactinospora alkalitolerans]